MRAAAVAFATTTMAAVMMEARAMATAKAVRTSFRDDNNSR